MKQFVSGFLKSLALIATGMLLGAVFFAAVCMPVYCPAREASVRNACIANLKHINAAKAAWALEKSKAKNDIPDQTDLYGSNAYIRDEPSCPSGGIYRIMQVSENPRCTFSGHTL